MPTRPDRLFSHVFYGAVLLAAAHSTRADEPLQTNAPRYAIAIAASSGHAAAQELYSTSSRHYEITSDIPPDELRPLARHMDAVFRAYAKMFSSFKPRSSTPIRLYLVTDNEAYTRVLADKGINGANSGGMFFWGGAEAGVITWAEGRPLERTHHVLQHEGFHQFAHIHIGGNFPIWANEGLAEYFGKAILVKGELRTGLVPNARLTRIKRAIENEETIPFGEFITLDNRTWSRRVSGGSRLTGMMYDQAWSVAHFLVHADNGRYADAFEAYIRETARGVSLEQAMRNAFKTDDLSAFERAWKEYTLALEPDPLSIARDRLEFLAEGLSFLDERGRSPASIEELRDALRAVGFKLAKREEGLRFELDSADDEHFTPPPSDRRRRQTEWVFEPTETDGEEALPPTISVKGMRTKAAIEWSREADGTLTYAIVFD